MPTATPRISRDDKYIVGLTGGIGSGKSTVSHLFEHKGIDVVDADIVAREVVAPGSIGLSLVVDIFGNDILQSNGELDRHRLRTLVFNNTQAKDALNAVLHPLIRSTIEEQLKDTQSEYCLLVAPLLFENNMETMVDCSLAVDIDEATQLNRALCRDGGDVTTIKNIMAAQITRKKRREKADDTIDNSRDANYLAEQVDDLHKKYLQKSRLKVKQ